jgi:hypothetical protein
MEKRRKMKIICRIFTKNKGRALREAQNLQVKDTIQLLILFSLSNNLPLIGDFVRNDPIRN